VSSILFIFNIRINMQVYPLLRSGFYTDLLPLARLVHRILLYKWIRTDETDAKQDSSPLRRDGLSFQRD